MVIKEPKVLLETLDSKELRVLKVIKVTQEILVHRE